ncbi:MAG: divalent-cation tolerance protein CutA [Erythrobacter sp.]
MTALIWCPFPDRETARKIAGELLDRELIGCANIIGEIEALYEWDGERGEAQEIGVLFKCGGQTLDEAVACLGELHPYDTPAILGWHCDAAHPATQQWLSNIEVRR